MGSGSGSGGEDPVTMGPGSGSEDPVDMGSGSGGEDPVTMGPGSGSGSGSDSGSDPSPGALCPEKKLMKECNIDCLDAQPDPFNAQQIFMSSELQGGGGYSTTWTILANNPANEISLSCTGAPNTFVTKCQDGEWTIPPEIATLCGTMDGGMEGHGSGSGDDGMMDHGSSSGTTDDGMMDHGSGSGSADGGMEGHGSGSGDDGMMDHGGSSGTTDDGMMDHGSGDGGMMDHGSSSG